MKHGLGWPSTRPLSSLVKDLDIKTPSGRTNLNRLVYLYEGLLDDDDALDKKIIDGLYKALADSESILDKDLVFEKEKVHQELDLLSQIEALLELKSLDRRICNVNYDLRCAIDRKIVGVNVLVGILYLVVFVGAISFAISLGVI